MNPYATGFDYPQPAGKLMMLKRFDQLNEQQFQQTGRHASRGRQHSHSCGFVRRETQHLREIRIQGNQGAAFGGTDFEDRRVG